MLLVLEPLTDVGSSVSMLVCAITMCLVIEPHSFIYVSIRMDQGPLTVRLIVFPHTLVTRTVGPDLHSMTIFFTIFSLTSVDWSVCLRNCLVASWWCGDVGKWILISTPLGCETWLLILMVSASHLGLSICAIFNFKLLCVLVDNCVLLFDCNSPFVLWFCSTDSLTSSHFLIN